LKLVRNISLFLTTISLADVVGCGRLDAQKHAHCKMK